MDLPGEPLPQLRFEIVEAARILRMSRATLYERIVRDRSSRNAMGAAATSLQLSCSDTSHRGLNQNRV
jgi:hypothetical protein